MSSEIFQKHLLQALEGLNGILCVADDLVVIGQGATKETAKLDHDSNLKSLKQRCQEKNIRLNDTKSAIEKNNITFMGHVISKKGISPDPSKVEAVVNMPIPSDVEGVRRFCGFVQYLSRFLPNLSEDLAPLRKLTCEGISWNWSEECDNAICKIKDKISKYPVLSFYDPDKLLIIQVDISKDGIGAVLLQDGCPIEFASRTMTSAEAKYQYAQIEKECLAVVFGLECFNQYSYGKEVIIQNDLKPLASILKKPLCQSPKRLQSMIPRIRRYNITFGYLAGKQLILADTLSRAALTSSEEPTLIHSVSATRYLSVSDSRLQEIKQATKEDSVLQELIATINSGWPYKLTEVSNNMKAYYDVSDSLSVYDGIVFKGEKIVIPHSMRQLVKTRLHAAHLSPKISEL